MGDEFKPGGVMDRQEMLQAAVYFLQNPQLLGSSLKSKKTFLLDKGLSEEEIEESINLALGGSARASHNSHSSSRWNFVFILGLCYGAYSLYNLYRAYLGTKKQLHQNQKQTQKSGEHREIGNELVDNNKRKPNLSLEDIMARMVVLQRTIDLQKSNLCTEIQSIKSLLLSHNQFSAPPTIPSWQMEDDSPAESNKPDSPIAPNPV